MQVLIHWGGEGMVDRRPAVFFFIPKKTRKLDDPENLEFLLVGIKHLQSIREMNAEVAQRLANRVLGIGDEQQQVAGPRIEALSQGLLGRRRQEFLDRGREFVRLD